MSQEKLSSNDLSQERSENIEEQFIKLYLYPRIQHFRTRRQFYARWQRILSIVALMCSAMIPLVLSLNFDSIFNFITRLIAIFLGVIVTVVIGWLQVLRYEVKIIHYGQVVTNLEAEYYAYKSKTGIYANLSNTDSYPRLVSSVMGIISDESVTTMTLD
jgi:hypothetical protein